MFPSGDRHDPASGGMTRTRVIRPRQERHCSLPSVENVLLAKLWGIAAAAAQTATARGTHVERPQPGACSYRLRPMGERCAQAMRGRERTQYKGLRGDPVCVRVEWRAGPCVPRSWIERQIPKNPVSM